MMERQPQHPFVPTDFDLPGYVDNLLSWSTILSIFVVFTFLTISIIWILSGYLRKLSKIDRMLICWFIYSSLSHIFMESYILFTPQFYTKNSYVAQIWKEYCKADSRYASRDSGVLSCEIIFVFLVGPACVLAAHAIAVGKSYSYILQFAISLGHLYGDAIYFVSHYLDGVSYAVSPYFFYAYYIGINSFWVVLPILICIRSWKKICAAIEVRLQIKTKDR